MAYTTDKKSTGLELLTDLTITQADLHIIGDVSDSGRAKAITEDNLEDYIANSDNFIDELTNNTNFQTNVNNFVTPGGSPLEIEQDGVSIETSVTKINFTNGPILTNPATGEVDVDFSAILSGGGSGTLIDSDTTQFTVTNGTGVNSLAYTINVPGGTLGTGNAIRVSLLNSAYTAASGSSLSVSISYGGQLVGSGSVSVGLSGKMDVSTLIVAAGSTNAQKSIAKSISQNTTTGGQITAFTSDHTTTVDSTIDQDITVEISGQFGVPTQQTIEGVVVEKLTKSLAGTFAKRITTKVTTVLVGAPTTLVIPHGLGTNPSEMNIEGKRLFGTTTILVSSGYSDFSGIDKCIGQDSTGGILSIIDSSSKCLYITHSGGFIPMTFTATADATNITLSSYTPNGNAEELYLIIDLFI